ncbi:MAG: cation:proton antiporter [Gemmatimonadaceae bacterium]|nr:cation:proton antiporter [Gemmatimonadaceae bacterium]
MPSHTALIVTVALSLGIAFLFGLAAARLKLPPLVGYLMAGIVVGPFTPGYVVDSGIITQAAELGVILLMFGVGLHFSISDLLGLRRVVIPGALGQSLVTGSIGAAIGRMLGLDWGGAVVLGTSVSVASTVVLLKSLEAQDRLDSPDGRMAVGWLVMEDLMMVVVLVLLPALAPMLGGAAAAADAPAGSLGVVLGIAMLKVAAFAILMVVVGRRAVPWLLEHVARLGSRELFTLAVLATALGIGALASEVFGVSFALGAFFAGAVVSESELSKRAATEALPMQDAFAVLFFLSVGMLFNPNAVLQSPLAVLALVALVLIGKFVVSYALLRLLQPSRRSALTIAASLAQIGEFSFIVSGLGVTLGLMARDTQALVIAAALISITINQPLFAGIKLLFERADDRAARTRETRESAYRTGQPDAVDTVPATARATRAPMEEVEDPFDFARFRDHVIVVGHGRVGTTITDALQRDGARFVIVEEREQLVAGLRARGDRAVFGDATRVDVLRRAGVEHARLIVVTAPEPIRARRIVEVAREANPTIAFTVRTHSATEQAFFEELVHAPGATGRAIYAEREAALSMAHFTLQTLGRSDDEADVVIELMRDAKTRPTETFAAMQTHEFRAMMESDPNHPAVEQP